MTIKRAISLLLILLLAFGLRLVNLNGRFLWYDEALAILFAEKSLAAMLNGTITLTNGVAANVHPLLYFWLLHGWMQLVGSSPAAVRLLSVLLGTATVFVGYLLGQEIGDWRLQTLSNLQSPISNLQSLPLLAALLIALSPFHIYYSQEARMYGLLGCLTMLATLFWLRGWRTNQRRDWLLFAVCGALVLYTHTLGALYLATLGIWAVWQWVRRGWQRWQGVVGSYALMLLLYAPWLTILPSQLGRVQQNYWVARPGLTELLQTLLAFHAAYDNEALPGWLLPLVLFLSLLVPIFLLMAFRTAASLRSPALQLLGFATLLPPALGFLVSQVQPVYTLRAFLPSALAYWVLLGLVLAAGKMPKGVKWGLGGLTAVILTASLLNHYTYATFPRPPFAAAAAWLADHAEPDAAIIHSNKLTFFPTYLYNRALPQQFIADEPGSPSDTLASATQAALGLWATADLETAVSNHPHVYLILLDRAQAEEAVAARQPTHPHLAWLSDRYQLQDTIRFNDLAIYHFSLPAD
ncbi:MAG: glycosyltransferase family 39 protein [Chloroflexota bacterium]